MHFAALAVLCSSVAAAGPLEPERVHARAVWVGGGGLTVALSGAAVLGYALYQRNHPGPADDLERTTPLVVGGSTLLAFGLHVVLLAVVAVRWPELLPHLSGLGGESEAPLALLGAPPW